MSDGTVMIGWTVGQTEQGPYLRKGWRLALFAGRPEAAWVPADLAVLESDSEHSIVCYQPEHQHLAESSAADVGGIALALSVPEHVALGMLMGALGGVPRGAIEEAIASGEITVEEIVDRFRERLTEALR